MSARAMVFLLLMLVAAVSAGSAQTSGTTSAYVIGIQDVLAITVFDQPNLSGKYAVESDGTVNLPWVGHMKADGLTVREFETRLKERLAKDFLRNPQLAVGIETYKSQRIFIMGNVRASGAYPLTGGMDLIEALSLAGTTIVGEVIIVRPAKPVGPVLPGQDADARVFRINVKEFQTGELSQNVRLQHGDTIFVPPPDTVYVFGEVNRPGAYPIEKDTTILQALTLAGGVSELASLNKIKVIRTVSGKPKETSATLSDTVKPGDTIWVHAKWF